MGQLPTVTREQLSEENQALFDRIFSGRTIVGGGIYGMMIHSPVMADRFAAVEHYFRFNSKLDPVDKELIILTIARSLNVRYPWSRHEILAKKAGMRPEALETLRTNAPLDALNAHERLIIEMTRALLQERKMPDEMFAHVQAELGNERLVEVVGLVAHYNFISMVARTFDVDVPPETITF